MDPTQTLELAQALKLSPTLLQSMNILQMTTLELSAYLKDLALENPVLEEQEGGTSWEEFAHQVSWLADQPGPSGGEAVGEPGRIDQETGFLSFLLEEQLDRLKLDQKILAVCRYLVGLLDDRGWLDPAVKTLQSLDPAGIGARNLGECLTLQLDRLPGDAPVARAICAGHLDQLGREAYAAIARELGVSLPQVREAANVIRALDPAPGREEEFSQPVEYVRPDAWVAVIDGELRVFTNHSGTCRSFISASSICSWPRASPVTRPRSIYAKKCNRPGGSCNASSGGRGPYSAVWRPWSRPRPITFGSGPTPPGPSCGGTWRTSWRSTPRRSPVPWPTSISSAARGCFPRAISSAEPRARGRSRPSRRRRRSCARSERKTRKSPSATRP